MASKVQWTVQDRVRFFSYHFLNRLAQRLAPPEVLTANQVNGIFSAYIAATLVRLNLPVLLTEQPRTSQQLAALIDCDAQRLSRFMLGAQSVGFVHSHNGRWQPTQMLESLRPDYGLQGFYAMHMCSTAQSAAWALLDHAVLSGENVFRAANGMSMWEWLEQYPQDAENFEALLGGAAALDAGFILDAYGFPESGILCDVGGRTGEFLVQILRRIPELPGALIDLPNAVARAKQNLKGDDVRKRIKFIAGDMFEKIDVEADVYIVKSVLHGWSDARCVEMLQVIHRAARPGSRVLVIELEFDRDRPSKEVVLADITTLITSDHGRERTIPEMQALLRTAGFKAGVTATTPLGLALVEGIA